MKETATGGSDSDIVDRLRIFHAFAQDEGEEGEGPTLWGAAADEIAALRKRLGYVKAALWWLQSEVPCPCGSSGHSESCIVGDALRPATPNATTFQSPTNASPADHREDDRG